MLATSVSLDRVAGESPTRRLLAVCAVIVVLTSIRLLAAALADLGPDETYYLQWARFPSAGYFDHPPMIAWWIAASTSVFGESSFGVRVLSITALIPTSLAMYATGRILFDSRVGERAALWTNAVLLLSLGIPATPDAPSVLFWSLATLAFALVIKQRQGAWWLAVGVFAGLGVISKLTNLFLGLGLLAYVLVHPDERMWLKSFWLWSGALVAGAIAAPMILWNVDHDWITFTTQMSRIAPGGFQPLRFLEFAAVQIFVLNPLIAVFAGMAGLAWMRRFDAYPRSGLAVLMWTVLPLVTYMVVHSFQSSVQGHWLAPVLPILALAAAAAAGSAPGAGLARLRDLAFPAGVAISFVGLIAAIAPVGLVPLNLDLGQILRGWRAVTNDVARLQVETGATWIASTNYASGAELDYHLRGLGITVIPINQRQRYDFAPLPPEDLIAGPALIITRSTEAADFTRCFDSIKPVGTIERRTKTGLAETFHAYRATGAHEDILVAGCDQLRRP